VNQALIWHFSLKENELSIYQFQCFTAHPDKISDPKHANEWQVMKNQFCNLHFFAATMS
jgi:hypothetical protein